MEWIIQHWDTIAGITGAVLALASVITGLTDTPIDDTIVGFIRRVFGQISFAEPRDADGTFKLPGARPSALVSSTHGGNPPGGRDDGSASARHLSDR